MDLSNLTSSAVIKTPPWPFAIEITNECPFKCIMCARTEAMTRPVAHMSFDLFKTIIDQFNALPHKPIHRERRIVWLHDFGESLSHPEFDRFIKYATNTSFKTGLSINPYMLTPPIRDRLLDSGISVLFCSLDGHDNKSFEEIRGLPNAWEKSFERMNNLLQVKHDRGLDITIHLSMINFNTNRKSIERLREYWSNHPLLDNFFDKEFVAWNGSLDSINALEDDASKAKKEFRQQKNGGCSSPWESVVVLQNGDVVPCCYDYDAKYVLGNMMRENIVDIWNGPKMQEMRRQFKQLDVSIDLCQNCERCPSPSNKIGFSDAQWQELQTV